MAGLDQDPLKHPEVQLAHGGEYFIAYTVSVLMMAAALWVVMHHVWGATGVDIAVTASAAVAVLAQSYWWERLDFSSTQIWNTVSVLLFIPLFVLTVGLTAWMFASLYARTTLPGVMP